MTDLAIQEVCQDCFGTGSVIKEVGAVLCDCRRTKGPRYLEQAEIPPRYTECSFQSYKPKHDSQTRALMYASTLANQYPVEKGLLFLGSVGTGKTHLATSALKSIVLRDNQGLFVEFGSLLKKIQQSYDSNTKTTEWSVLSRVTTCPVLVLDELGASRPTDWARDILYQVVNVRYNRKLLTLMTSNFLDKPPVGVESLEERIGAPLRSRIHEMCKTVELEGPDYRKTKDKK